jgi:superfamily II DNA/RNA helicase
MPHKKRCLGFCAFQHAKKKEAKSHSHLPHFSLLVQDENEALYVRVARACERLRESDWKKKRVIMQRLVMRAGAKEIGEEDGGVGHVVSGAKMNEKTVAVLHKVGVRKWTAMQEEAMERLFLEEGGNSRDGLICASTGSGKTYAFLMPVLLRFLSSTTPFSDEKKADGGGDGKEGVRAIAILPTRELAQQVFEKARGLFEEANGINVSLCVGGLRSHEKDAEDITKRKPKLVVGTPGRMLELKKLNVLDVSNIEVQILDEIDRLLDGGFENDVLDVLRPPGACQTICATATARGNLRRFLNKTLAFGYNEIGGKIATDENGFEVHKNSNEIGGNVAHCACAVAKSNSDNETAQVYAQAILTAFRGFVEASSNTAEEKSQCLCFVETKSLCDKIEVALQKDLIAVSVYYCYFYRPLRFSLLFYR